MADSKLSALAELAAANVDYAADLVYVVDTSATTSGSKKVSIDSLFSDITCAIGVDTANGIDYNPPGGDVDVDLITVGVTGTPKLWWDQSADQFALTKPLNVNGAGFMPVYATEAARDAAITSPVEGQVVFIYDTLTLSLFTNDEWIDVTAPDSALYNPVLWATADTLVGTINCSQLTDTSGNGNHITQSTDLLQPTVTAASINSKPSLHFDGDSMSVTFSAPIAQPYTILVVAKTTSNGDVILDSVSGSHSQLSKNASQRFAFNAGTELGGANGDTD